MLPGKASSVTEEGLPDGWAVPEQWEAQSSPGGVTRLVISAPQERLGEIFEALVAGLEPPLAVRYVQLTHRQTETQHVHTDRPSWVGVELAPERVREVFAGSQMLLYRDGRHQVWVRGALGDQLVLDELGLVYAYPDDPAMRDILVGLGVQQGRAQTLLERDFVRVELHAEADEQERHLIEALGLQRISAE